MLRHGVSLPALMRLVRHKDIRMILRYVQVTQEDPQRQFHAARQHAIQPHSCPSTRFPASHQRRPSRPSPSPGRHVPPPGMYRRQLGDEKTR
jgi:hypothetical protein